MFEIPRFSPLPHHSVLHNAVGAEITSHVPVVGLKTLRTGDVGLRF